MVLEINALVMVGIKKDINFIKCYKSKNDKDYIIDLQDGKIYDYQNIVFKDYMDDEYICESNIIREECSFIGKVIDEFEHLDEIRNLELTPSKLQDIINEVYEELKNLKIKFDKNDIKFYSFLRWR